MLFGPRAATRLNGPSVHTRRHGALLTQRYVRAVEGEKEREPGRDGERRKRRRLERRDRGRDRDARAREPRGETIKRARDSAKNVEGERYIETSRTHTRTHPAHARTPRRGGDRLQSITRGTNRSAFNKEPPRNRPVFSF